MRQDMTTQQLEEMIAKLEQDGLLQAPHTLEGRVMQEVAKKQIMQQKQPSLKWQRLFYQLKIGGAMAATLVLLFLPLKSNSYEQSMHRQASYMMQQTQPHRDVFEYVTRGANTLIEGITEISGYMAEAMMEVVGYDK